MEGNIKKLYKNVEKYFCDPGIGKNLLNKIPQAYVIKMQFDGCDEIKIKYFLVRGTVY